MLSDDQLNAMEPSAPLLVAEVRSLRELLAMEKGITEASEGYIQALELQVHDNQTLCEDYGSAIRAIYNYKQAAIRDEETIKELKAMVKEGPPRSETFREVRDERDAYLAALNGIKDVLAQQDPQAWPDSIEALLIQAGVKGLAK